MNPTALAFWLLLGIIGFLAAGTQGALIGIAIGITISLIGTLI